MKKAINIFFSILLALGCICLTADVTAQSGPTDSGVSASGISASGDMHLVQVKVTDRTGNPVSGIMTYIAIAAPNYELRTGVSDKDGVVKSFVPHLPGKGQFVFQADGRKDSNVIFSVERAFIQAHQSTSVTGGNYLLPDTSKFYGVPDKSYELDNYTRFASLEEVFREYVAEVKIGKQGEDFRLNVWNKPFRIFFENGPLVLLDGIPIFDYNRLLDIDPLKIRSIDVVARKYYLGSLLCNGIVSLFSFDGDLAGYSLPYRALVADFDRTK